MIGSEDERVNQDVGTPREGPRTRLMVTELPADFIDKRLADPMWSDGWFYGFAAALDEVAAAVGGLRPVDFPGAGDRFDSRNRALDDVLRAIASLRDKETAK